MAEIPNLDWNKLEHAYGAASDIPTLLSNAEYDHRPGHIEGTTWFSLWSALCHQGDIYTASYAAVPFLIRIAQLPTYRKSYDPILLAGCIEAARLEDRGPILHNDIAAAYREALVIGLQIAANALCEPLREDATRAYKGSIAAFRGDLSGALAAWESGENHVA